MESNFSEINSKLLPSMIKAKDTIKSFCIVENESILFLG